MSTELEDKDEVVDEEEEEDEEDLEKLEAEILRMEKEAALINKKAEEEEEGEDKADDAGDESKESGTAKLSAQANQDAWVDYHANAVCINIFSLDLQLPATALPTQNAFLSCLLLYTRSALVSNFFTLFLGNFL